MCSTTCECDIPCFADRDYNCCHYQVYKVEFFQLASITVIGAEENYW